MFCSGCGKEISDKAKTCPHCGEPTSAGKNAASKGAIILGYLTGFLVPVVGIVMAIYLLVRGRAVHGAIVAVLGISFSMFWYSILYAQPEFVWECSATGASSLQCEIRNQGSAAGSLVFDVVAFCEGEQHTGSVTANNIESGDIVQRVVELAPRVSEYASCSGLEYHNERIE